MSHDQKKELIFGDFPVKANDDVRDVFNELRAAHKSAEWLVVTIQNRLTNACVVSPWRTVQDTMPEINEFIEKNPEYKVSYEEGSNHFIIVKKPRGSETC